MSAAPLLGIGFDALSTLVWCFIAAEECQSDKPRMWAIVLLAVMVAMGVVETVRHSAHSYPELWRAV